MFDWFTIHKLTRLGNFQVFLFLEKNDFKSFLILGRESGQRSSRTPFLCATMCCTWSQGCNSWTQFPTLCKATVFGTVQAVSKVNEARAGPFPAKETAPSGQFFNTRQDEVSDVMELL